MIPLATILKAARAWKFAGSETDETAMRSFVAECIDKGAKLNLGDGKYATRSAVLEVAKADAPADVTADATFGDVTADVTRSAVPAGTATATAEQRIAHLEANTRRLEARLAGGAPGAIPEADATEIKVRSMGEYFFDMSKARGKNAFDTYEKAEAWRCALAFEFGGLFKDEGKATPAQLAKAGEFLVSRGIVTKDYVTKRANYATVPQAAGGALTSQAFLPDLLKLVNVWGVSRKLAKVVPMTQARVQRPRMTGDFTVSYPTEVTTGTAQTNTYSSITLDAKTGLIHATVSNQVLQDSNVDLAQEVAVDMARGFARQEDRALFIGDGTTTYGGMEGFAKQFADLTVASAAGATVGGANQVAHTDANILEMMSKLPDYAWPGACFACHPAAMSNIFNRLNASTPGGLTLQDFSSLGLGLRMAYRGFPIVTSNAINGTSAAAANTIDVYFGDFSMASMIGDRMGLEIAVDNSIGFREYAVAIRGAMRHDVNVHDIGDTSAAGPVVCLYQS